MRPGSRHHRRPLHAKAPKLPAGGLGAASAALQQALAWAFAYSNVATAPDAEEAVAVATGAVLLELHFCEMVTTAEKIGLVDPVGRMQRAAGRATERIAQLLRVADVEPEDVQAKLWDLARAQDRLLGSMSNMLGSEISTRSGVSSVGESSRG